MDRVVVDYGSICQRLRYEMLGGRAFLLPVALLFICRIQLLYVMHIASICVSCFFYIATLCIISSDNCIIFAYTVWSSWSWYDGSWIYNYLCNQCLSPPRVWVYQWLRFPPLIKLTATIQLQYCWKWR